MRPANVSVGSFATEMGCPRDVRFPSDSDRTADTAGDPVRAISDQRTAANSVPIQSLRRRGRAALAAK
jgi:hypothetical protein